jgi:hypothetical protein
VVKGVIAWVGAEVAVDRRHLELTGGAQPHLGVVVAVMVVVVVAAVVVAVVVA